MKTIYLDCFTIINFFPDVTCTGAMIGPDGKCTCPEGYTLQADGKTCRHGENSCCFLRKIIFKIYKIQLIS